MTSATPVILCEVSGRISNYETRWGQASGFCSETESVARLVGRRFTTGTAWVEESVSYERTPNTEGLTPFA
jgi:hypothetical protein